MTAEPARATETNFRCLAPQYKILTSDKRLIFAGQGVGSGKSECGGVWAFLRAKETPKGGRCIIAANTYPQLFDSTLDKVLQTWTEMGLRFRPRELPKSYSPWNVELWNGSHWVLIRCRSLAEYTKISGQNICWYWMDEAWDSPDGAFAALEERNRAPMPGGNRALITTTLDDANSWMYSLAVEQLGEVLASGLGEHWSWQETERMLVVYSQTHINHHLPDDYIPKLQRAMSERLYDRRVLSKWVSLTAGRVYHAFDRQAHLSEDAEYVPGLPVCWTHEFNIGENKPMSSALGQIKRGVSPDGRKRPELHIFDELVLESSDTNDAATECEATPWFESAGYGGFTIYGDASGAAKDTRSKTSDYGILRDRGFTRQRVPKANPPIRTRHNRVNTLLKSADGDVRVKIHPRCTTLAKGLETVTLKQGANYLEKETPEQHVTTALGYLICAEFAAHARIQRAGRSTIHRHA